MPTHTEIVRLRPTNASHWRDMGAVTERVPLFMRRFSLPSDPAVVVAYLTSYWASGSEAVAVWVMRDEGVVVGHVIAVMEALWGVPYGMILQVEIDHPYCLTREQHAESLQDIGAWARAQGASTLKMLTPRDPDAWTRHSGFVFDKTLLTLSIDGGHA